MNIRYIIVVAVMGVLIAAFFFSQNNSPKDPDSDSGGSHPSPPTNQATKGPEDTNPARKRLEQLLTSWNPEDKEKKLDWLAKEYGWTAVNIVKEQGDWAAEALLALGDEAVTVMREYPDTFHQLAKRLGGQTAVRLLVSARPYLKQLAARGRLPEFLDRIEALPKQTKTLGHRSPCMLPFLVVAYGDPKSPNPLLLEKVERSLKWYPEITVACLLPLHLAKGSHGVQEVTEAILDIGERAKGWIECRGLDGLLLAKQFPEWVDQTPPMELPVFLEALSRNQEDLRKLQQEGKLEKAWQVLQTVAEKARNCPETSESPTLVRDTWYGLLTSDEHSIRFLVEYDPRADLIARCLAVSVDPANSVDVPLPSLLIDGYHADQFPQKTGKAFEAVRRAAQIGDQELALTLQMLAMMARYKTKAASSYTQHLLHPLSHRFHELLLKLDHRVVFYAMKNSHNLTQALGRLEERGLDELKEFERPPSLAVQCIPGYDAYQLLWVMSKGYTPTWGELIFGIVDVVFTVTDLPGLKFGFKGAGKKTGKEIIEEISEQTSKRFGKQLGQEAAQELGQLAARGAGNILESSPQVLRHTAQLTNNFSWWTRCAERSAQYFKITLTTSTKVAKIVAREWLFGFGGAKSLEELAQMASQSPDTELFAQKILECLQWLEEKPVK